MKVSFQVARIWHMAKISPDVFCGPRVCPGLTSYYPYYLVAFFFPFCWTGTACSTSAIIRWLLQKKLIYQLLLFLNIFISIFNQKIDCFVHNQKRQTQFLNK